MDGSLVAVLDVGKTMAKLTLWTRAGELVARETRANDRPRTDGYATLDVEGIETWLYGALGQFATIGRIGAIVPVGHGAAAVVVRDGSIVMAPMDYEHAIDPSIRAEYDRLRAPFCETGSPALPDGLNLGAQLYALSRLEPDLLTGGSRILLWPQYWAWRLCGVAASEVTSLGCHTDLWNPFDGGPSRLTRALGWAEALPPLRSAADVLGTIGVEWRERCSLPADTAIHCGLHDSNAALLAARAFPELAGGESTVLSTGTWFVAMRSPAPGSGLPEEMSEARDCLVNIDAYGQLVPSARFMGGREIEQLIGLDTRRIDIKPDQPELLAAVPGVVESGATLLPTFAAGVGPFPHHRGRWMCEPDDAFAKRAAVSLYAALVADASLDLIGACDRILVEGRFAEAEVFVRALAALRPGDAVYRANAHNDVSFGALRLLAPALRPAGALEPVRPLAGDLDGYRASWRAAIDRMEVAA